MQKKPKVSIIIVYYKGIAKLKNCLESIKATINSVKYEVVLVDNGESYECKKIKEKLLPDAKYIKSPGNIGYAAGNNLGAQIAIGEYLLILNPDTVVRKNSVENLVKFLDRHKSTALVAPNLVNPKSEVFPQLGTQVLTPLRGIVALSFINKLFPQNPISKKYWLKDVPADIVRKVDCVPGSAFLVRKHIFEKLGGFDENFFLYFEETDFCKRVKETGLSCYINPDSEITHYWEAGKPNTKTSKEIFQKSRFYYFKKHFGLLSALVVEAFTRLSKYTFLFFLIITLSTFLRLYRLPENTVFHGEIGHNYLAIKNIVQNSQIPLVGPPTSHPWLYFGPLFYWIFIPFLKLSNFDPLAGSYFFAISQIFVILLNYIVLDKLFNKKIALISSFLLAISYNFLKISLEARFFSLVTLFFYPFLYYLYQGISKKNKIKLLLAGLFLGIMLNFHYAPLILLSPVFVILYKFARKKRNFIYITMGVVIPLLPLLIYDSKQGFRMISDLIAWIPYRIVGFFGLYPKNTANPQVIYDDISSFYKLVSGITTNYYLGLVISVILLVYIFVLTLRLIKEKSVHNPLYLLILILDLGLLAIFIHGSPPEHYYLPILPIPVILLSLLIHKLVKQRATITYLFLVIVFIVNANYYFSDKWFFKSDEKIIGELVPYKLQLMATQAIIKDAEGREFSIERFGPYDYFEGDFAQNYKYLLWWKGNEPKDFKENENAILMYKIYEKYKIYGNVIFDKGGLAVTKEL